MKPSALCYTVFNWCDPCFRVYPHAHIQYRRTAGLENLTTIPKRESLETFPDICTKYSATQSALPQQLKSNQNFKPRSIFFFFTRDSWTRSHKIPRLSNVFVIYHKFYHWPPFSPNLSKGHSLRKPEAAWAYDAIWMVGQLVVTGTLNVLHLFWAGIQYDRSSAVSVGKPTILSISWHMRHCDSCSILVDRWDNSVLAICLSLRN